MEKTDAQIRKFCWDNGVTIFPIREGNRWFVCAETQKKKTVYRTKELFRGPILKITEELQERIMNCYHHWYEKLNK